jgi:hypothetical protein
VPGTAGEREQHPHAEIMQPRVSARPCLGNVVVKEARALALAIAVARIVIGAALMLVPGRVASRWIGPSGEDPGAQLVTVATGARDLAVGAGTALALRTGSPARTWVLAGAFADVADLAATIRYRDALPKPAMIGVAALTVVGAAASVFAAGRLD